MHRQTTRAGELRFIQDLLVMHGSWRFLTHGENVLRLGMRNSDMLPRMALFLPRIVLFLLRGIFRAADGPLRSVGEHSQFLEFGKLLNEFLQRSSLRSPGTDVDLPQRSIQNRQQDTDPCTR